MSAAIAMPFDTLAFVKRLETAGVPSAQAEAQVEMLSDAIKKVEETRLQELATKGDVEIAKLELQKEIESVRKEIEVAKVDIIKWVVVTGIAILGGVSAINRLVPPPAPVYYSSPTQEMRQMAPVPTLPAPPTTPAH